MGSVEDCDAEVAPMTAVSEWSFHRTLFRGDLDHLDFPAYAADLGFDSVEYCNDFFRRTDWRYVNELWKRADQAGVSARLLMVQGCGFLGCTAGSETMERFLKWATIAKELGCEAMRVMVRHPGGEVLEGAIAGLAHLRSVSPLPIVVENHGGKSSDPAWLSQLCVRSGVELFSDFGNWGERDPYECTKACLPFTWGCSGKMTDRCVAFGEMRDLGAPKPSVEYEGSMDEMRGAKATKRLIETLWPTAETRGLVGVKA